MKLKPILVVWVLVLALALAVGLVALAQAPANEAKKGLAVPASSDGPLAGIGNPPPADYAVLYMFTGVANEAGSGDDQVTVVHCTNYHPSAAVEVRVQMFPINGNITYEATLSLASGYTRTFATRANLAFMYDVLLSPSMPSVFVGSGRVLVRQHRQVICTAQVLDGDADPPTYVVQLDLYRP
jgi:hypothetical protein